MLLKTNNLCKNFGRRTVVNDVNIYVDKSEVIGLLGRNGAGKTTTFKMIIGLLRPSNGSIEFEDTNITSFPVFKRAQTGIGYLSQEPSAFQHLSVYTNLMAVVEIAKLSTTKAEIYDLLEEYNLSTVANQPAYTLSGGEKRRLEICRVLILRPRLLLLDEPFSGLDPISVQDIQAIINLLKQKGISIVLTDHNVRETLNVTDRSYIINHGKIIAEGPKEHIVSNEEVVNSYLGAKFSL